MHIQLINTDTLAQILSVNTKRIYQMVKQNIIPKECVIKIDRNVRFDMEAIKKWIDSKKLSNR